MRGARGQRAPLGAAVMAVLAPACGGEEPPSGAHVFAQHCARCHGPDGRGGISQGAVAAPRNFTDAVFWRTRAAEQIRAAVVAGTPRGMPAFGAVLEPAQIDAVLGHLETLKPSSPP